MERDARVAKKIREARMLRESSAEETMEAGFELMEFGRELAEAADREPR